ncbi:MAG: YraN family protein [Fimbriimonadaceae bacterium]|nr:YraN family protein [Fimbriimonadaceae bacterium]QYK56282.1 MAG: YraN family protein [Fimbriimonadaceae bacterium]
MPNLRRLGAQHEDRAAQHLLDMGYSLVARRVKTRSGEIDIIALDGETLVFVEVKFRERGIPEAALDATKERRFHAAVEEYLAKSGSADRPTRYDFIAVTPEAIRHYPGSFRG